MYAGNVAAVKSLIHIGIKIAMFAGRSVGFAPRPSPGDMMRWVVGFVAVAKAFRKYLVPHGMARPARRVELRLHVAKVAVCQSGQPGGVKVAAGHIGRSFAITQLKIKTDVSSLGVNDIVPPGGAIDAAGVVQGIFFPRQGTGFNPDLGMGEAGSASDDAKQHMVASKYVLIAP